MAQPDVRVLLSTPARRVPGRAGARCAAGARGATVRAEDRVPGAQADVHLVSRDVTGLSTKQQLLPSTRHFHDLMRQAPGLQWVRAHAAGADRPVFGELRARGVAVATSSGANAAVVARAAWPGCWCWRGAFCH